MTMPTTIRVYTITDNEPHAPNAPAFDCEPDEAADVRWLGWLLLLCIWGMVFGVSMIFYGLFSG